ncbi:hypothetical protein V5799_006033 [Amblyomma americanum]|uniref:Uncharacterized protein n=1 Tax=Amblyomma americanum TaxID=6943 RepID=A0AAQ4DXJ4_AMBAM
MNAVVEGRKPSAGDGSDQLAFLLTFLHGRGRLYELFGQIEKEFESLYAENLAPCLIVDSAVCHMTDLTRQDVR